MWQGMEAAEHCHVSAPVLAGAASLSATLVAVLSDAADEGVLDVKVVKCRP